MRSKSIHGKSVDDIQKALDNTINNDFNPTLAIIFISIKQDRKAICNLLYQNNIDVIGATSSTEFIQDYQEEGSMVMLLLDLNRKHYSIVFEDADNRDVTESATQLAKTALQTFKNPSFILLSTLLAADGRVMDGETIIRSIQSIAGKEVNLFGGMAGDDITFTGTYVFTHNQSTDYGMVALVLNEDKVQMQGMAISGWKPIGLHKTITKSKGNTVYTIDNEPALDVYMRYLGNIIPDNNNQIDFFENLGNQYPIQIERKGREPMMCNPIGFDKKEKSLQFESNYVEQDSRFRFSTPPDFDIIETVINNASELKDSTKTEADALLIFSCAGRLAVLGPLAQGENEGLQQLWKAPMAGFYTYGEFGKGKNGKHEYHSTTCSWVTLKEK